MARTVQKNNTTNDELKAAILPENKQLMVDFLDYLKSVDRAPTTIYQYESDLNIFFVYNLQHNGNKRFTEITKREFARFQNHAINEWNWSSNRLRRVKSAISSLSNFIENILDEEPEYAGYRKTINKIESPVKSTVLEKSVFSEDELQRLLDYLVDNKDYRKAAGLALAMYSGRRKSELVRFKVSYFREENVVFNTFWKTDEKIQTKGRGSKGKQIHLYVLKNKFEPYLNLWMQDRERLGIESEWLLTTIRNKGMQLGTETLDDWADEFTKFLGKNFYWHSMRHFFCTMLARENIPANVIQDIIGWESADMVKIYTDITADENIGKYFDEKDRGKIFI